MLTSVYICMWPIHVLCVGNKGSEMGQKYRGENVIRAPFQKNLGLVSTLEKGMFLSNSA